MIGRPAVQLLDVAGVTFGVELPVGDTRAQSVELALAPFRAREQQQPIMQVTVERGLPPPGSSHPRIETPAGPSGWAAFEPRGVRVWGEDLTSVFAGLRLLLAREFPPPRHLLVHGVGLGLGGRGLLAIGPSGAGKSTLCGLFEEAESFSDELILLETGSTPRIHATPIRSSCERPPVAGSASLVALLSLEKAPAPALRPLPAAEALALLLEQSFAHPDHGLPAAFAGAASVVESVTRRVLSFPKDRTFVPLLRELLGC